MPDILLNTETARALARESPDGPDGGFVAEAAALPERVLQFGTGAFLRGFIDYFVEQANRAGVFNGRVVMVGSTGSGRADLLSRQDGLYTLQVRGRQDGALVDRATVIASVSRALSAREDWDAVLAFARSPELALVVSNTTETGITLDPEDRPDLNPPRSFPGKLTAVLFERAQTFDYDPSKGLIILPCELIEANGDTLRRTVQVQAERWGLGEAFAAWLGEANRFCNTLVDRIVPGTPDDPEDLYHTLGYRDALLTVAEPYRLWAIEGDADFRARFPLAGVDPGILIEDDITPYRERKVRLLNGAHTAMVPAALLCGLQTVNEAMQHPGVSRFIEGVMLDEIVPALDIDEAMARSFARAVLDRFANPFIRHELVAITLQQTMKMKVRIVPSLLQYMRRRGEVPPLLAFGFAAFILYQHPDHRSAEGPPDEAEGYWRALWAGVDLDDEETLGQLVDAVCSDAGRWGERLDVLPAFTTIVRDHLVRIVAVGAEPALEEHLQAVAG
jgi:tagaturonate reductase